MSVVKKVKVTSVSITKSWNDEDRYSCTVVLTADSGKIELKLAEDKVNQIVDLVAGLIVEATQEQMAQLTAAAMQHTALTHQPEESA